MVLQGETNPLRHEEQSGGRVRTSGKSRYNRAGAVCCEKPIGFVSRTLNEAEKKYSQIEKAALACVVGVTRFHSYLCGHHFTLQTDHKPLMTLFSEKKEIPQQAQRWAWKLASYEYTITWRASGQHANADALSRLPLREAPDQMTIPAELVLMVERLNDDAPITARQSDNWTRQKR